ncbi:MAG: hypothetical protein R3E66_14620 [bacterium]
MLAQRDHQPDQPSLSPGESTRVSVAVTRADGSPVSNARVTFWAVDESVLALAGYTTPDPLRLYQRI